MSRPRYYRYPRHAFVGPVPLEARTERIQAVRAGTSDRWEVGDPMELTVEVRCPSCDDAVTIHEYDRAPRCRCGLVWRVELVAIGESDERSHGVR